MLLVISGAWYKHCSSVLFDFRMCNDNLEFPLKSQINSSPPYCWRRKQHTHQVFAKMSHRNTVAKTPEETSLRRSPRLLLLKHSPKTPVPSSKKTTSPRNISSRKSKNNSTNCSKSSINFKKCEPGSVNYPKSGNGSRRKSNLGSGIDGICRSSRLCNEVTSLESCRISCDSRVIDGYVGSITRRRRNLKKMSLVGGDNLGMNDVVVVVESPVTPIGVGEKKCRGFTDSETSCSLRLTFGDAKRRITRSCTRKMGDNVETRKVENIKLKGSDLFESRVRECGSTGIGSGKGKEDSGDGNGARRIIVCGLDISGFGLVTSGVGKGRGCSGKDRRGIEGNINSCDDLVVEGFERRITRSASKLIAKERDLFGQDMERQRIRVSARNVGGKGESRKEKDEKHDVGGVIKQRTTKRVKRAKQALVTSFSARLEGEEATMRDIGVKKKKKEVLKCGDLEIDKVRNASSDAVPCCDEPEGEGKTQAISEGNKVVGVKRKRKQAGFQGTDQGWTKDQEAALQRAYFAAKPSPHFWKRVSKLVPGRSAQECFDKVHSVNLTPLSTRQSSRVKKQISPLQFSLKGDDMFNSFQTKSKKNCKTKRKSHVARRNVRHLLQKYCQDSDADLFSMLEPAVNPSAETLKLKAVQSTPTHSSGSPGSSSKCRSRSSLGPKKRISRLSGMCGSPITSPPVLKKVKNMALHEKYIDQLHIREGKRKVVSSRYFKSVQCEKDGAPNPAQTKNVIKAAKDALVSDARDVIEKFRHSQTNLMEAYSDSEEAFDDDNEDDMVL